MLLGSEGSPRVQYSRSNRNSVTGEDRYEGETNEDGAPHGQGTLFFSNGDRFEGHFSSAGGTAGGSITTPMVTSSTKNGVMGSKVVGSPRVSEAQNGQIGGMEAGLGGSLL